MVKSIFMKSKGKTSFVILYTISIGIVLAIALMIREGMVKPDSSYLAGPLPFYQVTVPIRPNQPVTILLRSPQVDVSIPQGAIHLVGYSSLAPSDIRQMEAENWKLNDDFWNIDDYTYSYYLSLPLIFKDFPPSVELTVYDASSKIMETQFDVPGKICFQGLLSSTITDMHELVIERLDLPLTSQILWLSIPTIPLEDQLCGELNQPGVYRVNFKAE